jgi:hypothetical protein
MTAELHQRHKHSRWDYPGDRLDFPRWLASHKPYARCLFQDRGGRVLVIMWEPGDNYVQRWFGLDLLWACAHGWRSPVAQAIRDCRKSSRAPL